MPQVTFYINKRELDQLKAKCKELKCSPYKYAKDKLLEGLKNERTRREDHSEDAHGRNESHKENGRGLEDWFADED